MDDVITHLSDGQPVALPYAYVGHHPADSEASSPRISEAFGTDSRGHPYRSSSPLVFAETENGGIVAVAADRMAHVSGCERCATTWDLYQRRLVGLPDGAMITAGVEIETSRGPGKLLIDAEDLPDEAFTEGADDGEG